MRGRQMYMGPLVAAALSIGAGMARAQAPLPPRDGAAFSADVVITRAVVDDRGTLVRELPGSRYRLTEFPGGRLRLTMLPPAGLPAARAGAPEAYAGITVEADPDRGTLDVRDAAGRPLTVPGGDAAWAAPAEGADALRPAVEARAARRTQLEGRYGRARGRVRGLDRYLARNGSRVQELLVHPDSALPAEMNVVDGEALVERHRFDYQRNGAAWLRRRTESETAMPGTPGQRLLSVSTLDDVRTSGGGR